MILLIEDEVDILNPSMAYDYQIDVVVVYRKNWKTISIYCNPKSDYHFGGEIINEIKFAGHPQACGSPRGQEFTFEDAKNIFNTLTKEEKFNINLKPIAVTIALIVIIIYIFIKLISY